MAKLAGVKRIRAAVRAEAAIRADLILNELLDGFTTEFDRRVAAGEPYELRDFGSWIAEAVEEKIPVALEA